MQQPILRDIPQPNNYWWQTTTYEEAETWLRDNQYIRRRHRRQLSWGHALLSLLYPLHTQFSNCWTHLLAAIYFGHLEFSTIGGALATIEKADFLHAFRLAAIICFLVSSLFHLFNCVSLDVKRFLNKMDYLAILSFLSIGGAAAIRGIYDGYPIAIGGCWAFGILLYMSIVGALFDDRFQSNDPFMRGMRAVTFLSFGMMIIVPFYVGWKLEFKTDMFNYLIPIISSVGFGLGCFTLAFPERCSPGSFDLFPSHAFFHVFMSLAAHFFYLTLLDIYRQCPSC